MTDIERTRLGMVENLVTAMDAVSRIPLSLKPDVDRLIDQILSLKSSLWAVADRLGYPKACAASIPTCKGWCCKQHFPKGTTALDFFMAAYQMPERQRKLLLLKIQTGRSDQCPMLTESGCFLTHNQRPTVCTNAYPCFANHTYWCEKEKVNACLVDLYAALGRTAGLR